MYHNPVMLNECLDALNINPDGFYVDITYGGGGHSGAILNKLSKKGRLIAFDQDEDAKRNLIKDERLVFIDQNFEFLKNHVQYQGFDKVDGLLGDLGVSSHQFDEGERGFSIRFDDAKLDMRMSQTQALSAHTVINEYKADALANVLYKYGELHQSRKMAADIIAARNGKNIETVGELKQALMHHAPKFKDFKFFAQVFQAIRIEVNQELVVLEKMLLQCGSLIKPGGRLVMMSYHSLEDRLVKNYMNSGNLMGDLEKDFFGNINRPFNPLNKKAIVATDIEQEENNRSRSAKLRIAERLNK
ncbi:MAG: 16S rRNA (cytosine(1402)-N(4))-methyltransferase RsmH [Bacteroidia bacterium]|nr:16S rRNA (cytosine(1402)-N(4))-methyltransferase RsmH [Bacteroidia bacterium]